MNIFKVQKRDGSMVDFDSQKITVALQKAMKSVKYQDLSIIPCLLEDIITQLDTDKITIPSVELIQEHVESQLIHH
jgi:anaerobic ribonucleoside-triphosphate reductase